jgi:hypothetical protein
MNSDPPRICVTLVLACALAGCATNPDRPKAPKPPESTQLRPLIAIERVPVKVPEALDVPRPAVLPIAVRGVTAADLAAVERIKKDLEQWTAKVLGISAVGTAEAVLLPGFFSGSLIVGTLILAPATIGLHAVLQKEVDTVSRVLKEVDLMGETQRALLARGVPGEPPADATQMTLVILAYGLVPREPHPSLWGVCLALEADLILTAGGRELFRDTIYLWPHRRSADAPPPVCGGMGEFAKNDGIALRNAARDYAQVLAAIALRRARQFPWKP